MHTHTHIHGSAACTHTRVPSHAHHEHANRPTAGSAMSTRRGGEREDWACCEPVPTKLVGCTCPNKRTHTLEQAPTRHRDSGTLQTDTRSNNTHTREGNRGNSVKERKRQTERVSKRESRENTNTHHGPSPLANTRPSTSTCRCIYVYMHIHTRAVVYTKRQIRVRVLGGRGGVGGCVGETGAGAVT